MWLEFATLVPSGYGTIAYTYNNLGQKTSMTVPLGKFAGLGTTEGFFPTLFAD